MNRCKQFEKSQVHRLGVASGCLLAICLFAVAATAQPPEAAAVMHGMVDAKIIKGVDYAFLAVDYDGTEDVLYFAARDGEHFDPVMKVVYSVPISAINDVNVTSNSDVTIKDGKRVAMGEGTVGTDDAVSGDFIRLKRGCTVKLVAKDPDFGWAGLAEGWVSQGKFAVEYDELVVEPTKEVDIGFYECAHAREVQREFQKLHKQVKKGM